MTWKPAEFQRATNPFGPVPCAGYVYRGLGLTMVVDASPKGRRPPTWVLIHLNSGHAVAKISGFVSDAFPIAATVAECTDWDFNGLDGWRNQDPDLPAKMRKIMCQHPKRMTRGDGTGDRDIAEQISSARALV